MHAWRDIGGMDEWMDGLHKQLNKGRMDILYISSLIKDGEKDE